MSSPQIHFINADALDAHIHVACDNICDNNNIYTHTYNPTVHICLMALVYLHFHTCILTIDVFSVILRLIPKVKEANSNHYLTASGICPNQEHNQACSDYTGIKAGLSLTIINGFPLEKNTMHNLII